MEMEAPFDELLLSAILVFYSLTCTTEEKSDYIAFSHLRIASNTPSPQPLSVPASYKMQKDCIQFLLGFKSLKETLKIIVMRTLGDGGKGLVKHGAFWVMGKPIP